MITCPQNGFLMVIIIPASHDSVILYRMQGEYYFTYYAKLVILCPEKNASIYAKNNTNRFSVNFL